MKHASPTPSPRFLSRALSALLAVALALPALPPEAAAAEGDISTNALSSVNGIMGNITSFQNAFGASNAQLQGLVTQLSGTQNAMQGAPQAQGQLDQIAQQLQLAVLHPTEGVQACIQKATRTYSKFHKNHPKAGQVAADKIPGIEPTCSNYGFILDAISTNDERISDTNKKMACIVKLQNTIGELANKAKQPISQLMTTAGEVYKTHTQIIDAHKQISTKLANELDGPDGKGGYRAQVARLRSLSLELNNVLNAKKGEKEGLKHGLVKQVDELQTMRSALGNDWYYTLMGDVSYCFGSTSQPCFDNGESMPPAQCVAALVGNTGGKTAGERARNKTDMASLGKLGQMNVKNAQEMNLPANLDIAKPGEFLGFARKRMEATMESEIAAFGRHQFAGNVDKSKLKQAVQQGYEACWNQAVATFNADLHSKGSRYHSKITAMKDAERETANDLKNWIDRVEGDMTQFRTAFHKVYNSELAQFKTDCTADEDPYRSLDCLRVLSATLDSGLKGTRRAVKLGNGSQYTSFAGETAIPMQTLTMDASGKPTIGTVNANCSGFDDCLNYLDRSRSEHESAAQKGEKDRQGFVEQHNSAVRAAFTTISTQFGQMSQLMSQGINAINGELAEIGVKGSLKTKDIKGEALVENEKTGMIDMPKDMKAAMANQSNYSEIEDTKEVSEAIRDLARDVAKKRTEASKMKNKCKIAKADYEKLEKLMPNQCTDTAAICSGNRVPNAGVQMEDLFRRSGVTVEDNERLTTQREFNQCKSQATNRSRSPTARDIARTGRSHFGGDWQKTTTLPAGSTPEDRDAHRERERTRLQEQKDEARDLAQAEKENDGDDKARDECNGIVFTALDGLAQKSRSDTLKGQNGKLVQSLRDLGEACSKVPKPRPIRAPAGTDPAAEPEPAPDRWQTEDSDVTAACEAYKTAAKDGKPPEGEEETKVANDGTVEPAKNPFNLPSFTAPAK